MRRLARVGAGPFGLVDVGCDCEASPGVAEEFNLGVFEG